MGVARSRGFAVSFDDVGSGPPVVLVSGFAWPASTWFDLGYVEGLVGAGYRVAVDPLGHGLSEKPYDWQSYMAPHTATDIVAAMDAAAISRATCGATRAVQALPRWPPPSIRIG